MSTFRSRQRAAQRRQPIPTAERSTPPTGNNAPSGPRDDKPFHKPRSGEARQDGKFGAPRERDPRFGTDKPRFGDKPREGGFDKPRFGDKPREGGFDKPRFGDKPREGGFDKPRFGDKPREGGFDKPRFGDKPREGGFDKPRFGDKPREGGFDKPRFGDKPREGGFDKPRFGDKPREGGFDKPRFGDKPREGGFDKPRFGDKPREGGFDKPRFGDKPREGGFDKPRFGDKPREGGFDKPRFGDKPREGGFDKPRFGDKPREGGFDKPRFGDKPREGGFDKPRFGDKPREGGFDKPRFEDRPRFEDKPRFENKPREDYADKPRTEDKPRVAVVASAPADGSGPKVLFGNRKIEDTPVAAAPAADNSGERTYTRDRVAGVHGKAHPEFQAPERREPAEPVRPKSFLKSPRRDDDAPRDARRDDKPADNQRDGGFQRDRTFDARGQDRSFTPREGGFNRDRTFDRHGSQPREGGFDKPRFGGDRPRDGERKPWQSDSKPGFAPREGGFDKPRVGGERPHDGERKPWQDKPRFERDERAPRDESSPRSLFGKSGGGRQNDAANVGRTPYAKPVQHTLTEGQLALFASCPRGLEKLLAEEIAQQGGIELQPTDGGVHFIGTQEVMMRVNLHSRTASRLLQQLVQGSFQVERDIYTLAKSIDWPALFDVGSTIKVKTDGHARLKSIDYVSLIVKDAICDRFRDINGERPSVDTRRPDMRIRVFLSGFDVQIYLDTSGEALFKRGWRDETGEAPLRENLAAGILLAAGYNGTQTLLDPMCGSGTFLVEAADIALNRAPGRLRSFAFEKLHTHNDLLWHSIRNDAELAIRPLETLAISGNDNSLEMVTIARHNLAQCGLAELISISHGNALDLAAPADSGLLVCNPPYGIRLDEQDSLAELYPLLASWLKHSFAGWTAHLMTADARLPTLMRLNAETRPLLYNGALECRVYGFPLVAGSNRKD